MNFLTTLYHYDFDTLSTPMTLPEITIASIVMGAGVIVYIGLLFLAKKLEIRRSSIQKAEKKKMIGNLVSMKEIQ